MKIGIVLSSPPGYSETFFNTKIQSLVKNGHEVSLFVSSKPKNEGLYTCFVAPSTQKHKAILFLHVLFNAIHLIIVYPKRAKKFIASERGDGKVWRTVLENFYINAHILKQNLDWLHFGFATMALRRENVAYAINAKSAVSLRGYDINIYPLKHESCYSLLWNKVNKVHSISDSLYTSAQKLGLSTTVPYKKITPAIATDKLENPEVLDISKVPVLEFFTIARLNWVKGLEYTLEALSQVKEAGIEFRYRIAGDGPQYERLVFACHQMGIEDNVVFLGIQTQDEIKTQLSKSHIYIQYSLAEGFCNSLLEAQGAGLLCIASDVGGIAENIVDNETGWLVKSRNPLLLAGKILEVIQMPSETLNYVKQNACKRIKEHFSKTIQIEEFEQFYT